MAVDRRFVGNLKAGKVHSDLANLVAGNGKALPTISKEEEGVQGMKYITDEQQEATFLFTATLVESLHGQRFIYQATQRGQKISTGAVWSRSSL
jgi:hypothetical protein